MNTTETTATTQAAAVAETGAHVAPKRVTTAKATSPEKGAPKAKKGAKKATSNKPTAKKPVKAAASVPREFSKKAIVIDLLKAKTGATMTAIQKATDWQAHTVRGFISGTLRKKMGLKIESAKNDAGDRCYKITGK